MLFDSTKILLATSTLITGTSTFTYDKPVSRWDRRTLQGNSV